MAERQLGAVTGATPLDAAHGRGAAEPAAPGAGAADPRGIATRESRWSSWRRPSGIVAILVLAYAAVVAITYLLHPADDAMALVSDFAEVPIELVGFLMCLAVVVVERRRAARLAWILFAVATAADGLGNLAYGLLDQAGLTTSPSIADACYLAFYPLLLVGLLVLPTASRTRDLLDWRVASNVAIVIVGGSMAVLHFVLAPVIPELTGDPLQSAILIAYPVGDLALLAALATVSTRRPFAGDQGAIALIGGVVSLWLVADILYAVSTATGDTTRTAASDLLYIGGALCMLLAAQSSLAQQGRSDRDVPAPSTDATRVGPYVMLLLGSVTLIAAAIAAYVEIALLAVMAVGLTALVVARQVVDERERRRADALLVEAHRSAATEARWKARHDPLTGLANRARLEELLRLELMASTSASRPVTVAFIDLDAFKAVNDTLGHAAGDELLVAVAQRLGRAVRSTDTVVRLGGDEFAIVLPKLAGGAALDVVVRAVATLDQPFSISGTSVVVGGSCGLATSRGIGVDDFDALLSRADTAMYRAKRQRLGPTFFDPAVDALPELPAGPAGANAARRLRPSAGVET